MAPVLGDILGGPALILQLLENIIEVILVSHDVQDQSKHVLVDSRHDLVESFCVNQDYFDDVWELLVIHLIHEFFLLLLQGFVIIR